MEIQKKVESSTSVVTPKPEKKQYPKPLVDAEWESKFIAQTTAMDSNKKIIDSQAQRIDDLIWDVANGYLVSKYLCGYFETPISDTITLSFRRRAPLEHAELAMHFLKKDPKGPTTTHVNVLHLRLRERILFLKHLPHLLEVLNKAAEDEVRSYLSPEFKKVEMMFDTITTIEKIKMNGGN